MEEFCIREIIPGHAVILEMKQHDNKPLSVLGVYAPNVPSENAAFWKTIQEWYEQTGVRKPDFTGGDTKIVEDALDRLPSRPDPEGPVSALDDRKMRT